MRYLWVALLTGLSLQLKAQQPLTAVMTYRTYFKLDNTQTQSWQSTMVISGAESLIEDEQQKGKPAQKIDETHSAITAGLPMSTLHYKNLETKQLVSRDHADAEMIIVDDELLSVNWKILSDQKAIGRFRCRKAQGRVRGRDYTAWFAPAVAVSSGPWKLHGLPGLILEAEDATGEVRFVFESLTIPAPATTVVAAPVPTKGQKRMTRAQQQQYIAQKYEAIRGKLEAKPGLTNTRVEIRPGKTIEINE